MPASLLSRASVVVVTFCLLSVVLALVPSAGATTTATGRHHAGPGRVTGRSAAPVVAPYGEVVRFGGFDTAAYASGNYTGKLTAGQFLDPVGLAADPSDPSGGSGGAVYVLDRTSDLPGSVTGKTTTWRLQKLSSTGVVLGTDRFSLPVGDPASSTADYFYEMLGLTVDPATGTVYALVDAANPNVDGLGNTGQAVAEILAWSTTPNGSGQLLGAAGMGADTLSAGIAGFPSPGRLSTMAQITQGGTAVLQAPQGLTVDGIGRSGGANYLAVQVGIDPTTNGGTSGIVQVCAMGPCGSSSNGAVTRTWSSQALAGLAGSEAFESPAGISTAADGSLIAEYLDSGHASAASSDVVAIPADLSSAPTELASSTNALTVPNVGLSDTDNGAISTAGTTASAAGNPASYLPATAVAGLSNGLFAAEFEPDVAGAPDSQTLSGSPGLWTNANPGIRLLAPEGGSGGAISNINPPLASLVDTLGNPTPNLTPNPGPSTTAGSACNLSDSVTAAAGDTAASNPSLAAGANGALWILTRGSDSAPNAGSDQNGNSNPTGGREVIELAPGAGHPCPGPSGTFSVASPGGSPQPASTTTPLVVTQASTVTFDESTINYLGGGTDMYVWDFGDGTPQVTSTDNTTPPTGAPYTYPAPTVSHAYDVPGAHTITLTVYGDFGVYTMSGTVIAVSASAPNAQFSFSPASPTTSDAITFDASGSTPSGGAIGIADYSWYWGDGTTSDGGRSAARSHTYAAPGTYFVTLTIHDTNEERGKSTQMVTVAPGPTTTTTTPASPPGGTPLTTPTPITATPPRLKVTTKFTAKTSKQGTEAILVSCPAGQASCSVMLKLETATTVTASGARKSKKAKKAKKAKKKTHRSILSLGSAHVTVPGGQGRTIQITLRGRGLVLLRTSHSLRASVSVDASNPQGESYRADFTVKLRFPSRKSSTHHKKK